MSWFHDDAVLEAIASAAELADDQELGRAFAHGYASNRAAFTINVLPDETISLGLTVIVMDHGKTLDGFLVLTSSRAILTWSSGLLRRKTQLEEIPYASIRDASWRARRDGRFNGAYVCSIVRGSTTTLVLPKSDALADRIVELLGSKSAS